MSTYSMYAFGVTECMLRLIAHVRLVVTVIGDRASSR